MNHQWQNVEAAARGNWKSILSAMAGLSERELSNRHQPCPMCGGVDRYRFDDKDGTGSYICGQCGAGSGMNLLMGVSNMDFNTAVNAVGEFLRLDAYDQPVARSTPPPPATTRKTNYTNPTKAQSWLAKTEHYPISALTARHFFAPNNLLVTETGTIIVPIESNKTVVNAAAIAEDGRIAFAAGHFTYGGFSWCGNNSGKSVFICANWIESWVTATATNCRVACCWNAANFEDVATALKREYEYVYLALNNDFDELASAEYANLKCIIPAGGERLIVDAREFEKKIYGVGELLDAMR